MMRPLMLAALGAGVVAVAVPSATRADSYWELEHARANARAGGPVSERDKELLERYGCLSGSRSRFCEELRPGYKKTYRAKRARARRD